MRIGVGIGPFYVSGRVGGSRRRRPVRRGPGNDKAAAWIMFAIAFLVALPFLICWWTLKYTALGIDWAVTSTVRAIQRRRATAGSTPQALARRPVEPRR